MDKEMVKLAFQLGYAAGLEKQAQFIRGLKNIRDAITGARGNSSGGRILQGIKGLGQVPLGALRGLGRAAKGAIRGGVNGAFGDGKNHIGRNPPPGAKILFSFPPRRVPASEDKVFGAIQKGTDTVKDFLKRLANSWNSY